MKWHDSQWCNCRFQNAYFDQGWPQIHGKTAVTLSSIPFLLMTEHMMLLHWGLLLHWLDNTKHVTVILHIMIWTGHCFDTIQIWSKDMVWHNTNRIKRHILTIFANTEPWFDNILYMNNTKIGLKSCFRSFIQVLYVENNSLLFQQLEIHNFHTTNTCTISFYTSLDTFWLF